MSFQRMATRWRGIIFAMGVALTFAGGVARSQDFLTQNPTGKPEVLKQVGFDQNLNAQVPLDVAFRDERGANITLRQILNTPTMQGKPAILELVYYQCPMLCTEVMNATLNSLKEIPLEIGKDFSVITVSIDPTEKPVLAEARQIMYAGLYGRPGAVRGWHFLTGDAPAIQQLAAAVGFRYVYDKQSSQFAHASGIMVLTPAGRISRYYYGIAYKPRDLRLGLVEASESKIGSAVDAILLYCYHYDPSTGKYGLVVANIVRAGAALTVVALTAMVLIFLRREKHSLAASGAQHKTV
jgi:protein SCO1/2